MLKNNRKFPVANTECSETQSAEYSVDTVCISNVSPHCGVTCSLFGFTCYH